MKRLWIGFIPFEIGYAKEYYDGWNHALKLGFISIEWVTPPLKKDNLI